MSVKDLVTVLWTNVFSWMGLPDSIIGERPKMVQWSGDVEKADPFFGRARVRFSLPPWVSNTIARDHLSTGGGPVGCVQLSEGGFQVVYPLGLWSQSSGVVKVLHGYG